MQLATIALTLQLILAGVESSTLPAHSNIPLIDVHHHFVPDFYARAVAEAGGDPSGWPTPAWNLSYDDAFTSQLGIGTTIFSLTAPGASISPNNSRSLARMTNEFCANIRDQNPSRYGCFAALPDLLDIEGSLAEIRYALDVLRADGVTLFTRYGDAYLGHEEFDPIWAELNARNAVVLVHPTTSADLSLANPLLPQPVIDYPHETTRTAMELIFVGNRRRYPNCKVILSHAGGNLPWLISRAALWRRGLPAEQIPDNVTYDQMMSEFSSFYYDLALSSTREKLDYLLKTVPHENVLYGSDFPYAQTSGIVNFKMDLDSYPLSPRLRRMIYRDNALRLIPRLRN